MNSDKIGKFNKIVPFRYDSINIKIVITVIEWNQSNS